LCIGMAISLAANFSRASMLKWIQKLMKSSEWGEKAPSFYLFLFRDILIITGIQIVILIVWSAVDPYATEFVVTDPINLIGEYACDTPFWGYYIIELGYIAILAGYGIFVIYQAWNLSSQANQVKWILITTYNYIMVFLVFSPLFVFLSDERSRSIMAFLAIMFLSLQSEICFYLPGFLVKAVQDYSASRKTSRVNQSSRKSSDVNSASPPSAAEPMAPPPKPITHAANDVEDGEKTEPSEGHEGGGGGGGGEGGGKEDVTENSES